MILGLCPTYFGTSMDQWAPQCMYRVHLHVYMCVFLFVCMYGPMPTPMQVYVGAHGFF